MKPSEVFIRILCIILAVTCILVGVYIITNAFIFNYWILDALVSILGVLFLSYGGYLGYFSTVAIMEGKSINDD